MAINALNQLRSDLSSDTEESSDHSSRGRDWKLVMTQKLELEQNSINLTLLCDLHSLDLLCSRPVGPTSYLLATFGSS